MFAQSGPKHDAAILCSAGMLDIYPQSKPVRVDECGEDLVASFNGFPYKIHYTFAHTPQAFLHKAREPHDWMVTDLNYGRGLEYKGQELADQLRGQNTAICTSEDDVLVLEKLSASIIAAPSLENDYSTKFECLGRKLAAHLKKTRPN